MTDVPVAPATDDHAPQVLARRLHDDGIAVLRGAFPPAWAARLDDDLTAELGSALRAPGGVAPRGWNRFYFEPYAERVRGFWDVITHPAVVAVCEHVLGPDWRVVELGCDVPLPGAQDQPWHRDFPMPPATRRTGRLTSIAINAAAVDVVDGPFQAVLGTHREPGDDFDGGMFPPDERSADLTGRLQAFYARAGNLSFRSGLMLHRGSAMGVGARMRPVAIVGVVAPDDRAVVDRAADPHDPNPPRIRMSQAAWDGLPLPVRARLSHEIVGGTTATLPPHHTEHSFEGLRMDQRRS